MEEEFDSGFEISESMSDFADDSAFDVGSVMDEAADFSDVEEISDFDLMDEDSFDVSAIMDDADIPDAPEITEDLPFEEDFAEDIPAEPEIEVPFEEDLAEDVPAEPEITEDIPIEEDLAEDVPAEPEITEDIPIEEDLAEDIPAESEITEDIPVEEDFAEDIPAEPEITEDVPIEEDLAEDVPAEPEITEDIPVEEDLAEDVPAEPEIIEDIPVEEDLAEDVPAEPEITEDIPVEEDLAEDIPAEPEIEVPFEEDLAEDVPAEPEITEDIPFEEDLAEDVPAEPEVVEHVADEESAEVASNGMEAAEESVDYPQNEVEETADYGPGPAQSALGDYLAEHNYGREDYAEYSQDPEWQQLNNDFLEETGREPIDYTQNEVEEAADYGPGPAQGALGDYLAEHNYGREDYAEYSQDPEWQQLNNDFLEEIGREPIDYTQNEVEEAADYGPGPAQSALGDYLAEHNYGREDYAEYSQDPEWQQLNNDFLEETGREPIDYTQNEVEETADYGPGPAQSALGDYLAEHNYGREDYAEYSQDPEWQQLNNDFLEETGREPIDYTQNEVEEAADYGPGPAQSALGDYLAEHNYGREDYAEYSQDPEWQQLNNDFLEETGREPIDYTQNEVEETADYGPGPAQSALGDYLAEHNYGREDYAEYSQDPEWQQLNNDFLEETGREPIDYTQTDAAEPALEGAEVSIQEEAGDCVTERVFDDFEESIRLEQEDFYDSGTFYTQGINEYGYTGTCGETSMASTINRVLETNEFTENKVLDVAVQEGLCDTGSFTDSGGTTTDQFMELYDRMNDVCGDKLNVERHDFEDVLSMEEVAQRLDEGCTLNVAVDSNTLWDQVDPMGSPFPERRATDHWITVTGVQRSEDGAIQGFDIIDSGGGESYVDADKYQAMCYGTDSLELTDPTCIVVSKKEQEVLPEAADAIRVPDAVAEPADVTVADHSGEADEYIYQTDAADRIFAADALYDDFSGCPEDSDEAFALQRQIHQAEVGRRGGAV